MKHLNEKAVCPIRANCRFVRDCADFMLEKNSPQRNHKIFTTLESDLRT